MEKGEGQAGNRLALSFFSFLFGRVPASSPEGLGVWMGSAALLSVGLEGIDHCLARY